jgi:hypothetical protein
LRLRTFCVLALKIPEQPAAAKPAGIAGTPTAALVALPRFPGPVYNPAAFLLR